MLPIDWTGERFVHGAGDAQLWYEHAHRYAIALGLAEGRRVLDVGSGEGYGAAWLATRAESVVGVDIAPDAVDHANSAYGTDRLRFRVGDAMALDAADFSADLVVCFETIEHVGDPGRVVAEIARVLAPGGLVLISTPDADRSSGDNPFHQHELSVGGLTELIDRHFAHRRLFGQRVSAASLVWPLDSGAGMAASDAGISVEPSGVPALDDGGGVATYTIALCSQQPLDAVALPGPATLTDPADALLADLRGQVDRARDQLGRYEADLARRGDALRDADRQLDAARTQLHAYESELAAARSAQADAGREVGRLRTELAVRTAESDEARTLVADAQAAAEAARESVAAGVEALSAGRRRAEALLDHTLLAEQASSELRREFDVQRNSLGGRLIARYRRSVEQALPPASQRRRIYQRGHRAITAAAGAVHARRRRPPALPAPPPPRRAIELPVEPFPLVSIVVPVFGQLDRTLACLASIADAPTAVGFEVIVVDDASPDGSADALGVIPGLHLVRNAENLGYLRSTNMGATRARGEFIVLLNNDTVVRAGWLDALVGTAEADASVGAVGTRLLYPDGRLSEAGGIVFADGTPWIYGRGDNPDGWRYAAVREVDYCSAACLLVRAETWRRLGGFDERYAPAYYEDTDLCFRIREIGQRVVYQPRATVVHDEGGTHGSDAEELGTRLRAQNHVRFIARWQRELGAQPLPGKVFRARRRGPDRTVLVVDHHLPTPDRDSGSVRITRLLDLLRECDRHVVFLPRNAVTYAAYARRLQQRGIEVIDPGDDLGRWLDDLAGEVDLVMISRPDVAQEFLPSIRHHLPRAVVAYDMVDYHALRESRRDALSTGSDPLGPAPSADGVRSLGRVEAGMCEQADIIVAVSDVEADLVRRAHPDRPVVTLPNVHSEALLDRPFADRDGFLFVGGFAHPPNRDAVRVLVSEIWPRVRAALPGATLHLVGSDMSADMSDLRGDGVTVHGWVPDLEPLLSGTRVFVAPLRYGAGLKGKVGQAMAVGLPVVTTSVGAEGLGCDQHLTAGDLATTVTSAGTAGDDDADAATVAHLCVQDDLDTFAKSAVQLHQDPELWRAQAAASRRYIDHTLGPDAVRNQVRRLLASADEFRRDAATSHSRERV